MNRSVICFLACMVSPAAWSAAGQDLRPGIIGEDNRVRLNVRDPHWDAIGHVNVGGHRTSSRCTGTLVAPNLVITAAHCVMDLWKGQPFPLRDIHFLAGVQGPENRGHATAKCLHFPKNYEIIGPDNTLPTPRARKVSPRALASDVVAIVLNERLAVTPAPLAENVIARPGLQLAHLAYPADRRFVLTAHFDCLLLQAHSEAPLWFNDCDTHPASSGGPLFIRINATYKLAAIMLSAGERIANTALPISEWNDLLRDTGCP